MNKRALCSAAVTCSVLLGCAGAPGPDGDGGRTPRHARFKDQVCTGAVCEIDVNVVCVAGACTGVVDPKVLLVLRQGGPKLIRWKLKGEQGYEFKDEKVNLSPSEFDCDRPGEHKKEVTCKDKVLVKDVFEYQLNVIKGGDGSALAIDPWIVNN